MIETINQLMRTQKRLLQDFGREPSSDEIADEMQLPVDRVPRRAENGPATDLAAISGR